MKLVEFCVHVLWIVFVVVCEAKQRSTRTTEKSSKLKVLVRILFANRLTNQWVSRKLINHFFSILRVIQSVR